MQGAFVRILEFFDMFGKVVVIMFQGISGLLSPFKQWFVFLKGLVDFIPDIVKPFLLAGVVVSILYFILGRG